ncbi:predicted protein [Botrytis cinerea T4]|uniref:Uncharacterized protein n=1 Tax=Botryotinia fuckeliana (strain T4) TaxID=999810 RepID=G2YDB5_BOTF4|nr:predicted protein [Botrytis cinerea T4]
MEGGYVDTAVRWGSRRDNKVEYTTASKPQRHREVACICMCVCTYVFAFVP